MSNVNDQGGSRRRWVAFSVLAAIQLGSAAWLAYLSVYFAYGAPTLHRPIPLVVGLLVVASLLHLLSVYVGCRLRPTARLIWMVLAVAVGLRAIWVVSHPIQEVDLYRYMWDGAVLAQGVSPYDYSPLRVLRADLREDAIGPHLERLVRLRDANPELREILRRVHFAEIRTVYPPVSQAVFAIADMLVTPRAAVQTRLLVMKLVLVAFDLAVLVMLLHLLHRCGLHPAVSILWGWSPLVLKEFAGSGHLDSIAVALCVGALLVAVEGWRAAAGGALLRWSASGLLLGLAIGAKLYPIVLLPLVARAARLRSGWWAAAASVASCGLVTSVTLTPMFYATLRPPRDALPSVADGPPPLPTVTGQSGDSGAPVAPESPALAPAAQFDAAALAEARRTDGLRAFLGRWQMNDWAFMILEENVRPGSVPPSPATPWFAVVPDGLRHGIVRWVTGATGLPADRVPFWMARAVTLGGLAVILLLLTVRLSPDASPRQWLAACCLALAWFWMLSPTQNPWYWSWALPLVPFVRNPAWRWVSTCVLLYYLRFWFAYQFYDRPVLGTSYRGATFFDFVVVWFEHLPLWCAIVGWAAWDRIRIARSGLQHRP